MVPISVIHQTDLPDKEVAMPTVLYERRGRIAYVTLNRPKDMNAINEEMHKLLWEVWQEFAAEEMATRILPNEQWRCARPLDRGNPH